MMQSILEVVDVTRSSNVRIDQNQAIRDTAFSNYFLNITSDATNFISFFRVYPNFFDISCGLASNEFSHVVARLSAVVDYFSLENSEDLSRPGPIIIGIAAKRPHITAVMV